MTLPDLPSDRCLCWNHELLDFVSESSYRFSHSCMHDVRKFVMFFECTNILSPVDCSEKFQEGQKCVMLLLCEKKSKCRDLAGCNPQGFIFRL